MDDRLSSDPQKPRDWTPSVLRALVVVFCGLAAAFLFNLWGQTAPLPAIPLVDPTFLDTATVRRSYADLVQAKEDLSDFDCYACHEKGKPPVLRYDAQQNLIVPQEHSTSSWGTESTAGTTIASTATTKPISSSFTTRDGREVKFQDSPQLCGSCHGPTYRDWEAGAHGRTSGYWDRSKGPFKRKQCVNCHDPHSPQFPGAKPAPGPHLLRPPARRQPRKQTH